MYAETSNKNTQGRVAIALLCGLAICCSVMYITADGDNEMMHETITVSSASAQDAGTSVGNSDVLKAGQIYSDTPRGNMRLMDYFTNVEHDIAQEVAHRKQDIASVRAAMARDFAFNAAARAKLNRDMLHKMAQNAKTARRNLDRAMRKTQLKMAHVAHLQNRRNNRNKARSARLLKAVAKDKRESAKHLKLAVHGWQAATQAWGAKTQSRIKRMNAHVSANAAQIKENARKARKDLDNTMHKWDHSVSNFRTESKNARSKLSAQFAAQGKATRAWANNKIKAMVAQTGAQFNDVETKMAKNRAEVDMQLKHAVMKLSAAMNAAKATESKRFAIEVADIDAQRKRAASQVKAMAAGFKVQLLSAKSTIKAQLTKQNDRIDRTAGVVRSDAARNAKRNAAINGEMTNMIKIGNERYAQHLKDDKELHSIINKNKAKTDEELNKMAATFNNAIAKVQKDLKAQRKHAHDALNKQTQALYKHLYANQAKQAKKNAKLEADTRRMELDAMDALRRAKADFKKKIFKLSAVVKKNDEKADKKIKSLTGVVTKNAAKSANGRHEIQVMEASNKAELQTAVADAIKKGEDRANAVEAKGAKMDKDTKWLVNNKLSTEIHKLRDETNNGVEALALQSKEARAAMRKEMLFAIRSAAAVAKADLALVIADTKKKMAAAEDKADAAAAKNALERKAVVDHLKAAAAAVKREIKDAVATDARAQLALETTVKDETKKTRASLDRRVAQLKKGAKATRASIKALAKTTIDKLATEEKRVNAALKKHGSKDAARQAKVLSFLRSEIAASEKSADDKFGKQYLALAKHRENADQMLAGDIKALNDALAKQAAIQDTRFSKTVKDVDAAKKEVFLEVKHLRKELTTSILSTTATLKASEESIKDSIMVVSGEVSFAKAQQADANREVILEMKRIEKMANSHTTTSKRARGQLRRVMDDNKRAAAAEVKALAAETSDKLSKLRAHTAHMKRAMAKDLSKATENWMTTLGAQQKADAERVSSTNAATAAAVLAAAADMKRSKKMFDSKILMLTNQVSSNAKAAERGMARLTGVVHDYAKVHKDDMNMVKKQTEVLETDLKKALQKAISMGTARAKATAQRIAEHQKGIKRFLQVELVEQVENAADNVLNTIEGGRQKIADNYLSLKAYAVSTEDKVSEEVSKGKGRALSSIGDMLVTVGALADIPAPSAEGVGFGGSSIPQIFSGKTVKVSNAMAAINGLVNEYSQACAQVRLRWPLGLGKYLMDRFEMSMADKGVLQVDKIEGKSGNFVYINGRSVGLSNKLSDFAGLASRMNTYEDALSKLTAKITAPKAAVTKKGPYLKAPEWMGN